MAEAGTQTSVGADSGPRDPGVRRSVPDAPESPDSQCLGHVSLMAVATVAAVTFTQKTHKQMTIRTSKNVFRVHIPENLRPPTQVREDSLCVIPPNSVQVAVLEA